MDEKMQSMPAEVVAGPAVDQKRLQAWTEELRKYKTGKRSVEERVIASEQWWKLRNGTVSEAEGFKSRSAWLHNVIVSKHADAAEAYPQPKFLPREATDRPQAEELSAIVPVILKQNKFKKTYSKAQWRKQKFGTAVYKIVWSGQKLGGLGDIGIESASLLNVFWEPGVEDIQKSKYFFHTELVDKEILEAQYPEVKNELKGKAVLISKFLYDDNVSTEDKVTVIEVYYHKGGKLHYCKYVGNTVLYATENDPKMAETGLYDHGKFPYVFDALYPVEGSPCGYGFVDICRNPQEEIDLMNTAILKNTMAGATPRFFVKQSSNINEKELTDLTKVIVHTTGNLGEDAVRVIDYQPLQGNYISAMENKIAELRETSGNTETAAGTAPGGGVTAASAIAALQEASGKGSRDATRSSYEAFEELTEMCVELIRQFYTAPRKFRITNKAGQEEFVTYRNDGLQPQSMGVSPNGEELMRLPVFDIEIVAEKQNAYTTLSNNEMALQFFQLGFFDSARVDQTLMCLEMMDFRNKAEVVNKVQQMGTLHDRLELVTSYAAALAAKHADGAALQQIAQIAGVQTGGMMPAGTVNLQSAAGGADSVKEHATVEKSRKQSREASQPEEGA